MPRKRALRNVIRGGDRRESLEAIRDHLAVELEQATGREVAAIAKQLTDVIRELASLPTGDGSSTLDEIAKRRESRRRLSGL